MNGAIGLRNQPGFPRQPLHLPRAQRHEPDGQRQ